jgi:hypothetical protein
MNHNLKITIMKKINLILVLILMAALSLQAQTEDHDKKANNKEIPFTSISQSNKQFSKLEITLFAAIGEIVKLFREEHNTIWPGFDLSKQPFILYIHEKWVLIVNYDKKIEGFSQYPKDWPEIHTQAMIHFGNYKDLTGQLQFNFEVDSIKTVAIGLPEDFFSFEDDKEKMMIFGFIIHESFHQYQRQSFGEIPWSPEEKYPILDVNNTASAYLEMQLLIDAVEAMDLNDKDRCQELMIQFAALRAKRWEDAGKFVKKYEQGQELNEGTAKYVEVKSILKMNKIANKSDSDVNSYYLNAFKSNDISYLINDFEGRIADNTVSPEDMIRNRIYPVGAAQGILMDYLEIDWKSEIENAGSNITFNKFILKQFNISNDDIGVQVSNIKKKYEYDNIVSSTKIKINEYLDNYTKEISSFDKQEGLRIEIDFHYSSLSLSTSSKAKKWVMDKGTQSLCMNYRLFKLKTKHVFINLENLAVMQHNNWDEKNTKIIFYITDISSIEIDSIKYNASNISNTQFSKLSISGKDFEINYNHNGQISVSDNMLSIKYEH